MKIYWKQAGLFLLMGLLLGGAIGRWGHFSRFGMKSAEQRIKSKINHFGRELDLTPDQKQKVETIIRSKREKINALRLEVRPRFDQIWADSKAEIRALLSESQKLKFEALEEKMEKKRQRRRENSDHYSPH